MQKIPLTENEKKIIRQVAEIQINSLTQLNDHKHPEFEEFLDEYAEAYQLKMIDITESLTDTALVFEEAKTNPQVILGLNKIFLLTTQFIISHRDWFPIDYMPIARKKLVLKLKRVIDLKDNVHLN